MKVPTERTRNGTIHAVIPKRRSTKRLIKGIIAPFPSIVKIDRIAPKAGPKAPITMAIITRGDADSIVRFEVCPNDKATATHNDQLQIKVKKK